MTTTGESDVQTPQSLVGRLVTALVFGIYFGVVVLVELAKIRHTPGSVQMLVNTKGPKLQTEVRVDGWPVYLAGVTGTGGKGEAAHGSRYPVG